MNELIEKYRSNNSSSFKVETQQILLLYYKRMKNSPLEKDSFINRIKPLYDLLSENLITFQNKAKLL